MPYIVQNDLKVESFFVNLGTYVEGIERHRERGESNHEEDEHSVKGGREERTRDVAGAALERLPTREHVSFVGF